MEGNRILGEKAGSEVRWYHYDSDGTRLGMEYGGETYYYYYNAQGDVLGLFDKSGGKVVEYTYDSWGKLISTTGSKAGTLGEANPFRYRGYYYDSESGLYYLNSRYYDPETGRFVNADGQLNPQTGLIGNNLFVYCNNNPIKYADHNGTMAGIDDALIVGGTLLFGIVFLYCFTNACINYYATTGKQVSWDYRPGLLTTMLFAPVVYLAKKSKEDGKARSTWHPSWVNKDMVDKGQSAEENARRLLNDKYGKGNWKPGPGSEFNQIKKWLTRDLKLKSLVPNDDNDELMFIDDYGDLVIIDPYDRGFGWINGQWYATMF